MHWPWKMIRSSLCKFNVETLRKEGKCIIYKLKGGRGRCEDGVGGSFGACLRSKAKGNFSFPSHLSLLLLPAFCLRWSNMYTSTSPTRPTTLKFPIYKCFVM